MVQLISETIENFLVPKHALLSRSDIGELLKKTGFGIEQLPQILSSDPAIKNLKAEKDDIIKIVRISPTAGKAVYYRRVV